LTLIKPRFDQAWAMQVNTVSLTVNICTNTLIIRLTLGGRSQAACRALVWLRRLKWLPTFRSHRIS